MAFADLIVPRGGENSVAINLIVQHIRSQLLAKVSTIYYNIPTILKRGLHFQIGGNEFML